jgi:hypothetical protein
MIEISNLLALALLGNALAGGSLILAGTVLVTRG